MLDYLPETDTHYVLKSDKSAGLPKKISCVGPFGQTNLVECIVQQSSAAYRHGENIVMCPIRMNRLYSRALT
jgi:hypothetical protein